MVTRYELVYLDSFREAYLRITKNNLALAQKIEKALILLQSDTNYPSLKTHKVNTRLHGSKYSSRVTGDIRLIWDFNKDYSFVLLLIDLGGHSGKNKVYD